MASVPKPIKQLLSPIIHSTPNGVSVGPLTEVGIVVKDSPLDAKNGLPITTTDWVGGEADLHFTREVNGRPGGDIGSLGVQYMQGTTTDTLKKDNLPLPSSASALISDFTLTNKVDSKMVFVIWRWRFARPAYDAPVGDHWRVTAIDPNLVVGGGKAWFKKTYQEEGKDAVHSSSTAWMAKGAIGGDILAVRYRGVQLAANASVDIGVGQAVQIGFTPGAQLRVDF